MTNWCFSNFSKKIGFDISCKCKLICMKCQTYYPEKNKNISKCHLLKFLPSVLSVKILGRMASRVDPDQTALQEQSDLGLHYFACICHFVWNFCVWNFRTFTVLHKNPCILQFITARFWIIRNPKNVERTLLLSYYNETSPWDGSLSYSFRYKMI